MDDLKAVLADMLKYTDKIKSSDESLASQHGDQAVALQGLSPLRLHTDAAFQKLLDDRRDMLRARKTAVEAMHAQEPGLLRIIEDLTLDNDEQILTPTFNDQIRACSKSLRSAEDAKATLKTLTRGSGRRRSMIDSKPGHQVNMQTGQLSDGKTYGDSYVTTRSKVKCLEATLESLRHVVDRDIRILLDNKATRDWAKEGKSAAAVAAAEQYKKYLDRYVKVRKAHDEFRLSSHSHIEGRRAEAGRSYDQYFWEGMQVNINSLRTAEQNFAKARYQAMQQNVELLAVPPECGDVLPEVIETIPGDGESGSWNIEERNRATLGLDRARIEDWITKPDGELEVVNHDQHDMFGRAKDWKNVSAFVTHDGKPSTPSVYTWWSGSSAELTKDVPPSGKESLASASSLSINRRRLDAWDSISNIEPGEMLGCRIEQDKAHRRSLRQLHCSNCGGIGKGHTDDACCQAQKLE